MTAFDGERIAHLTKIWDDVFSPEAGRLDVACRTPREVAIQLATS
jgi:hypothetical protein